MTEYMYSHLLETCLILSALSGVVRGVNETSSFNIKNIILNTLVSGVSGMLFFFLSYDLSYQTPARMLAGALITGYGGNFIFFKFFNGDNGDNGDEKVAIDDVINKDYSEEPPPFELDNSVVITDLNTGWFEIDDEALSDSCIFDPTEDVPKAFREGGDNGKPKEK